MNFFSEISFFFNNFPLLKPVSQGCEKDVFPVENDEEKTFTNYFDVLTDSEGNLVLPLNTTIQLTMTDPKTLEEATAIVEDSITPMAQTGKLHHSYLDDQGNLLHNVAYINDHPGETIPDRT